MAASHPFLVFAIQKFFKAGPDLGAEPIAKLPVGKDVGQRHVWRLLPELFQFCRDTTPIRGSLDQVLSSVTSADIARAIKSGACGVYHGCVHNMLYEKSEDILKGLYKSASFVLQAVHFQRTGVYVRHMADLVSVLPPEESAVLQTFMELKGGRPVAFDAMSEQLFSWAGKWAGAPR